MDEQTGPRHPAAVSHHWFDSGHDLCISGSCSDKDRLLRLERIRYAHRRVTIASPSSPACAGEDAFACYLTNPDSPAEGNFEIGRILHLKSEIRNFRLDSALAQH